MLKTHNCGELRAEHVSQRVASLAGFTTTEAMAECCS